MLKSGVKSLANPTLSSNPAPKCHSEDLEYGLSSSFCDRRYLTVVYGVSSILLDLVNPDNPVSRLRVKTNPLFC